MIEVKSFSDGALLEVHMSGRITADDYRGTLVPAMEAALETHDHVRMLVEFTPLFEGFDMGAAWEDTKLGMSHWSGFERIGVIADKGWLRNSVRMMGPLMPCPVRVFDLGSADEARRWMRESLGAVHVEDLGDGAVHVRLLGQIDPEAIAQAEGDLDAIIRKHDDFRLLIDLSEFDGWQGLSAMGAHFKLAREHAPLASRIAIISDKSWQKMTQRLGSRFINATSRLFESSELDAAKAWLKDG